MSCPTVPPLLASLIAHLAAAVPSRLRGTFTELLLGAAASRGGHVTDAILTGGLSCGWTTYYWALERGRWSWLRVWEALLGLLTRLFAPAVWHVVLDDSIVERVSTAAPGSLSHHNHTSKPNRSRYLRGQGWLCLAAVVERGFKVGAVPLMLRLVRRGANRGKLKSAGLLLRLEDLVAEDQAVLRAGLETARWITVDDTAARHPRQDGFTTHIGDDRFTAFRTGETKSRQAFLSTLRAGHDDYVINDAALAYMRGCALAGPVIEQLAAHPTQRFVDEAAWEAHLAALGIDRLEVTSDPVRIATEGALWGSITAHGLLAGTVVVSDDAGQFRVGEHALCWAHAERLVHKLVPANDQQRRAIELTRTLIWWFYADLKAYKRDPCPKRARALRARFDRIFTRKSDYVVLDRLLVRLHRRKAELLRVLDRPEIPLHTNASENDIRACVTKRKISGGTMSADGRTARDVLLGLMKTCRKLGVSFYRCLGDRLHVPGAPPITPSLTSSARPLRQPERQRPPSNLPRLPAALLNHLNLHVFLVYKIDI